MPWGIRENYGDGELRTRGRYRENVLGIIVMASLRIYFSCIARRFGYGRYNTSYANLISYGVMEKLYRLLTHFRLRADRYGPGVLVPRARNRADARFYTGGRRIDRPDTDSMVKYIGIPPRKFYIRG